MSWTDHKRFPFRGNNTRTNAQQHHYSTRDLEQNVVLSASLRKLNKLQKRWFVLYGGSGPDSPAHLEYYDNESKWRAGEPPKRDIVLNTCFNICRKKDSRDSMHRNVIAIYTLDTCLSILFEEEQVLQIWLDSLLSQQKGRSEDGKIPKPNYEHMWEVNVKQFKPEDYLNTYSMSGTYRLCATPEELRFFATGSDTPITFKIINLRSFSCTDRRFQLETGRRTPSGSGWLYIRCEDKEIAANLYRVVSEANAACSTQQPARAPHMPSSSSVRTHRESTSSATSAASTSAANIYRPRSESCGNADKLNLSGTSVPKSAHLPSSGASAAEFSGNSVHRIRTISEGNPGPKSKANPFSGSPMSPSPGSYVSSESNGSSNSIDDVDFDRRHIPSTETPKTIFEESSAESMVDPKAQMLIPTSSRDYGAPPASRGVNNNKSAGSSYSSAFPSSSPPRHQRTMSDTIQYTPVDPIPAANAAASSSRSKCDEPLKTLQPSNHNNNSSSSQNSINSPTSKPGSFAQSITSSNSVASGGGGTQYTSIVSQLQQEQRKELLLQQQQLEPSPINPMTPSSSASAAAANSDYMVMTPTDSGIDDHPPPGSLPRFGNEYEMMSPVSVNPGRLESTRRSGVAIVPSSSSSNTASTSVGSLNNALPPVAPVTPAAPYNVISPKSGIEESNPPSSLPSPTPLSAIEERLGGPGGSTAASTTSSSVEGGARPKTSSSFSAASGAASASSSRSQSSLSSAQHKRSSFFSSASMTAPDRTTTDVGGGGSGAGASGRCSSPSWDPLPFDGPPTSSYPSDPVQDQRQLDYVPIDYSHSTSRISAGAIPIPMASALGSRMSPASSSSLVSGTPNSTESRFPAEFQLESKSISYLRDDDDELDEPPAIPANANQPPLQPYSLAHHHHSKSNSNASSTTGGSRSRTGSISRFIDIPGGSKVVSAVASMSPMGKTPPSASNASTGPSPNLLTRWFRSRTGSVPSKPDEIKGRRRHRTQSEGEKDSPENQEVTTNPSNNSNGGRGSSKEGSPTKQVS